MPNRRTASACTQQMQSIYINPSNPESSTERWDIYTQAEKSQDAGLLPKFKSMAQECDEAQIGHALGSEGLKEMH